MSSPEDDYKPGASSAGAAKPSLLDNAPPKPGWAPGSDATNLRMLVELESSARPMERSGPRRSVLLIGALCVLVGGTAAAWWWSQSNAAPETQMLAQVTSRAVEVPVSKLLVGASAPKPSATMPAVEPASTVAPARIEMLPEATMKSAESTVGSQPVAAQVAQQSPVEKTAMTKATARVAAKAAAKSAVMQTAATPHVPAKHHPATHVAAAAIKAEPNKPAASRPKTPGKDADIALLTALLEHVSRDGQSGPLTEPDQLTIAQLVQRCDARGGRGSAEARECHRRICDGYWGKAQACPARSAKKG